jgi:hypothetical protein
VTKTYDRGHLNILFPILQAMRTGLRRSQAPLFAIVTILALVRLAMPSSVHAQDSARTVDTIKQATDTICGIVKDEGSQTQIEATGKIGGVLNNLIRRLIDIDASLSGNLARTEYQGVIREQLAEVLIRNTDCRQHVFDKLLALMVPTDAPSHSATTSGNSVSQDSPTAEVISPAEEERREKILSKLYDEFDRLGGCPSLILMPAPSDWTNKRLVEIGDSWRVPPSNTTVNLQYNAFINNSCNRITVNNGNGTVQYNTMIGPNNQIDLNAGGDASHNFMAPGPVRR